jgi:hypothetical protein
VNRDEIRRLIGGYATGTLSPAERQLLFEAALDDQELFEELAGEQSLKELLDTPGVRARLAASLDPADPAASGLWWRKPWAWVGAASLAGAALLLVFVLRAPEPVQIAESKPSPLPEAVASAPAVEPLKAVTPAPSVAQEASKSRPGTARDTVAATTQADRRSTDAEKKEQSAAATAGAAAAPPPVVTPAASPEPAAAPRAPLPERERQTQAFGGFAGPGQASQAQNAQQQTASQQSQRAAGQLALTETEQGAELRKDQVPRQQDATPATDTTARKAAPPAKAVAKLAAAAGPSRAFTYAISGGTVRVTPPIDGFFQVASRLPGQTITSAPRRASQGETIDFPVASGARTIVITFAATEAALASPAPPGPAPASQAAADSRERSGSVPLPPNTGRVSVEITLP